MRVATLVVLATVLIPSISRGSDASEIDQFRRSFVKAFNSRDIPIL